jgi:hypothetical protein
MRRGWFVLIMGAVLACLPAAAPAGAVERAKPLSRVDHLAAELRRDPVYVTDHAPRALPADAAARIRRAVARLGVPVYVAVTPTHLVERYFAEDLVPLIHDRVNRPGLYVVADPTSTRFFAAQYGATTLPVKDAMYAANSELPTDAGAVAMIERFVEIALSGHAAERREKAGPRPKSKVRIALDARDRSEREASRAEWRMFAIGTALSGVPLLLLLMVLRGRSTRTRAVRLTKNARTGKSRGKRR